MTMAEHVPEDWRRIVVRYAVDGVDETTQSLFAIFIGGTPEKLTQTNITDRLQAAKIALFAMKNAMLRN